MQGNQVIAQILKAEGVEWLSCFPAQSLIDVASMEGIRPIMCRQERAGVNMADGLQQNYQRQEGRSLHHADAVRAPRTRSAASPRLSPTRSPSCCFPGGEPSSGAMGVHADVRVGDTELSRASPSGPRSFNHGRAGYPR